MNVLLIVLMVLATLACSVAWVFAGQLQSSDPAGNGLAQVYFAVALGCTWLLVGVVLLIACLRAPVAALPASLPWGAMGAMVLVLFLLGVLAQFVAMNWMFDAANKGAWRSVLLSVVGLVPLAFVVFAAWRGVGLPIPTALATWGCGLVVLLGSLLPFAARATGHGRDTNVITVFNVPYPALLLHGERSVRVLRYADDLNAVRESVQAPLAALLLVDANGITYALSGDNNTTLSLAHNDVPMPFDSLCARLLRIPVLDADTVRDAEIRKLIRMQRDVTALSFVLDR